MARESGASASAGGGSPSLVSTLSSARIVGSIASARSMSDGSSSITRCTASRQKRERTEPGLAAAAPPMIGAMSERSASAETGSPVAWVASAYRARLPTVRNNSSSTIGTWPPNRATIRRDTSGSRGSSALPCMIAP